MQFKPLLFGILYFLSAHFTAFSQVKPPMALGPLPNENQLQWQEMEYYAFVHFSVNK